MAIGSNNPFPSVLVVEGTVPSTPSAGQQRLYIDSTTHLLKVVNSSGTASNVSTGLTNPLTTTGDVIYSSDNSGTPARLPVGAAGKFLSGGTTPAWGQGPLTTTGDLMLGASGGVPTRLAAGTSGYVLTAAGAGAAPTWAAASGGGDILPLDVPPGSAHAKDDEFPGTSLDGKWTDPTTSAAGQTNTITVANSWMILEPATAGTSSTGKHVFGIRQAAPTGSFTLMARIAMSNEGADIRSGLFVGINGGKAHVVGNFLQDNLIGAIGVTTVSNTADWSAYDTFLSTTAQTAGWHEIAYVRIRWVTGSSTLFFDFGNGVYWKNFTSRTSMSQPDQIGIALYSNSGTIGADQRIAADWFRVTEP